MTPTEKAAQTNRERHEKAVAARAAARRDREQAIAICRKIRDDENATDADRLEAIRLIAEYTA